jgi:hypothetical protein
LKDAHILGVVLVRTMSGAAEILAAAYILRKGSLRTALRVNAVLGLVGPTALVLASAIAAAGLRGELGTARLLLVFVGVTLIILATR